MSASVGARPECFQRVCWALLPFMDSAHLSEQHNWRSMIFA